jgi:hypothetical protein
MERVGTRERRGKRAVVVRYQARGENMRRSQRRRRREENICLTSIMGRDHITGCMRGCAGLPTGLFTFATRDGTKFNEVGQEGY